MCNLFRKGIAASWLNHSEKTSRYALDGDWEHDKKGARYYKSVLEFGGYVCKVLLLTHPELQPSQKHQVPDRV